MPWYEGGIPKREAGSPVTLTPDRVEARIPGGQTPAHGGGRLWAAHCVRGDLEDGNLLGQLMSGGCLIRE